MDEFLHRLKWTRAKAFSSQADLVDVLNKELGISISRPQWNKMENGTQAIPIELLPALCKALDCTFDWLLLGVEAKEDKKFSFDAQEIAGIVDDLDADLRVDVVRFANRINEIQQHRRVKDKEISRLKILIECPPGRECDDIDGKGFIYFVLSPDSSAIKIGFSVNPRNRMRYLANASAHKLELLHMTPGTVKYEKSLHEKFSHLRLNGEWFADSPQLRHFIDSLIKGCNNNQCDNEE